MSLSKIALKLFGKFIDRYNDFFQPVKESIPKANLKMTYKTYLSLGMFIITLVFFVSVLVSFFVFRFFGKTFVEACFYSLIISMIISMIEFVFMFYYPINRAASRRRSIESNLPFVITHMGALSQTGIPPYVMFKLISKFDEYGEIAKEMKKIVRNIEVFGMDPITAIKEVAKRTPSEQFRQLLMGFVTTTESGGNIKLYLKEVGEQIMFEWRTKREKYIRFLDTFSELYTGIVIAAPLFLISLLAVMSMLQPTIGGWDILTLTKLSTYLVIPIINIGFILFLHGIEVEM